MKETEAVKVNEMNDMYEKLRQEMTKRQAEKFEQKIEPYVMNREL